LIQQGLSNSPSTVKIFSLSASLNSCSAYKLTNKPAKKLSMFFKIASPASKTLSMKTSSRSPLINTLAVPSITFTETSNGAIFLSNLRHYQES
jgi:hypothetical protein